MPYWTTLGRDPRAPESPGAWQAVEDREAASVWQALPQLLRHAMTLPEGAERRVLKMPLSFCPDRVLYEFVATDTLPRLPRYVLGGAAGAVLLDGSNAPVYALGRSGALRLDEQTVADYVRFFLSHVVGRDGRFLPLESVDTVPRLDGFGAGHQALLARHARPLAAGRVKRRGECFELETSLLLGQSLAPVTVRVDAAGRVDLDIGEVVAEALPLAPDRPADADHPGRPRFDFLDGWRAAAALDPALRAQLQRSPDLAAAMEEGGLAFQALPFFDGVVLLRRGKDRPPLGFGAHALLSAQGIFPLHGSSTPIFEAIERETFRLDDASVADYLTFFCDFVHGEEGPFRLVARPRELNAATAPAGDGDPARLDAPQLPYRQLSPRQLDSLIGPVQARRDGDGWRCAALNQYGNNLFMARFLVRPTGEIEMTEDQVLVTDIPIDASLDRMRTWIQPVSAGAEGGLSAPGSDKWPAYLNARKLESSILDEYVRQQLLRALREGQGGPLLDVDAAADDETLLRALAVFLYRAWPVVIIESPIPCIEEIVARLLRERIDRSGPCKKMQAAPQDASQGVLPSIDDGDTLLVSLHQWHRILRPEAVAYRLGVTDAVTLVGCDTPAVVPDALQRVADIELTLGGVDDALFRTLFCGLFDCDWPDGGAGGDGLWPHYVMPGDFYVPVRDMLQRRYAVAEPADAGPDTDDAGASPRWTPAAALAAVRARVQARLSAIEVDDGPGLDELHGLGEARAVLKDLLADIRAAVSGAIPWDAVDRGMLLVGEPGVGKTLLARALARDGGVRFIHASEARWIEGTDGLSAHILAIRATFAEARRSAPCILFIDELDSIGNRQLFEGRNKEYCTEIVNTLLQELQGVIDRQGVFVIGATNYLEYVDPALTRAGRLDQVVRVPRPDRRALQGILDYYLQPYARDGRLDADIDSSALAGMALGATGADIEFFVRDAARRARKAGVPLGHGHLAAAITRAPRDRGAARRLAPEEQARTAVHEAGHAIALLACGHYPARLSVVSIIPRSNGSLGFTGALPDARNTLTRRACDEYLQVLLAGRAAEEQVYGSDGVSSGAGGSSDSSDLALATRWAARMVGELGFGPAGELRWQPQPESAAAADRVRRLLDQAYTAVSARLAGHRPLIHALRDALLDEHELYAPALYRLAAEHDLPVAAGEEERHVPGP